VRDGVDGFIVEYGSPQRVVRCLEELRSDPERRVEMGRSAQVRQRAMFSDASFAEAMASVWRRAAARRDGRFAGRDG
jgi:glycosyltransferase involved in cell wall biosynthesis